MKDKVRGNAWRYDDNIGYSGIHAWLYRDHGKADRCEGKKCEGKSTSYEWAKKNGCPYERNRDNFFMLCKSCHIKYDYKKDTIKKFSLSHVKYDANKIRSLYFTKKYTQKELATIFGCNQSNISYIINNKTQRYA